MHVADINFISFTAQLSFTELQQALPPLMILPSIHNLRTLAHNRCKWHSAEKPPRCRWRRISRRKLYNVWTNDPY